MAASSAEGRFPVPIFALLSIEPSHVIDPGRASPVACEDPLVAGTSCDITVLDRAPFVL